MTIRANDTEKNLLEVMFTNRLTTEEATYLNGLSAEDKVKADFERIAKRGDFASKVAQTIIDGNFEKLSAKQADIINRVSIYSYDPIYTEYDYRKMDKWAEEAGMRQMGYYKNMGI